MMKNIPEILNQPTGIAALASLGIHGAIALIVPLMPVESTQSNRTNSTQAVGLMELTQADLERLPQTGDTAGLGLQASQLPQQPQVPLPDFDSKLAIVPPVEPPLSTQPVLPAIPQSATNYNLSYLPRKQSAPRLTRNDFRTQISNYRVSSNVSRSDSPFVDDIDAKIKESQLKRRQIRENQASNFNRLPESQVNGQTVSSAPLLNPSPDAIDIGSTQKRIEFTESEKIQLGDQPLEIAANNFPVNRGGEESLENQSKLLSPDGIVIPSTQNSTGKQTIVPTVKDSESQVQKKEHLIAKLNSHKSLREQIQEQYPDIQEKAAINQTISTDKSEIEGTVLGRLVVDPDGKVLDIKFQDGTATPELQSKTREFFHSNPPQAEAQISSYPFQLRFTKINDNQRTGENRAVKLSPNQDEQRVSDVETKKQPENQAVVVPNSSSISEERKNQLNSSTQSGKELIEKLRQVKQGQQTPN
jgi:hypothetical protein